MPMFGVVATKISGVDTVEFTTRCPGCKKEDIIKATVAELDAYRTGVFIQQAFKSLNKDQREQLISGYCSPCWDKTFGES